MGLPRRLLEPRLDSVCTPGVKALGDCGMFCPVPIAKEKEAAEACAAVPLLATFPAAGAAANENEAAGACAGCPDAPKAPAAWAWKAASAVEAGALGGLLLRWMPMKLVAQASGMRLSMGRLVEEKGNGLGAALAATLNIFASGCWLG